MKVVSVNVGLPREVEWKGQRVSTGIFKKPVESRVRVRTLNLEGDRQADLTVHGGWEKAVYTYPSKGYALWRKERPELDLPWSKFGENLTTEGLLDEEVNVGDWFRIGSAEFVVTEPRLPCYKLGIKMGRDEFVAEFLERGLLGFYLAGSTRRSAWWSRTAGSPASTRCATRTSSPGWTKRPRSAADRRRCRL